MATRVIDDTKLNDIAVAIQAKDNGGQMTVDEMPTRIENIPTGGGTLISKTITQNGVYNASSDNADGYDVVTVGVPEKNTLDEYFANTLEVANLPSATSIPDNCFLNKTGLKNVIMPNVVEIRTSSFRNCTNLNLEYLPGELIYLGGSAFQGCIKLALKSLPIGVTRLDNGNATFAGCVSLTWTKLPNIITGIGPYCFQDCIGIPYLDFSDFTQIPTVATSSFVGTSFPFYFRDQQQLDEWAAATNWSNYADRFQIKPSGVI